MKFIIWVCLIFSIYGIINAFQNTQYFFSIYGSVGFLVIMGFLFLIAVICCSTIHISNIIRENNDELEISSPENKND